MRRQWWHNVTPLGWFLIFFFTVAGLALIITTVDGADSIWVEIKPPQEESLGQAIRMVCPVCGKCYPKQPGTFVTTAMWCPGRCCNVMTLEYRCCTYKDSMFTVKLGECDWIKWGRKVAKKDIDSLVNRDDWTIKKKKDK